MTVNGTICTAFVTAANQITTAAHCAGNPPATGWSTATFTTGAGGSTQIISVAAFDQPKDYMVLNTQTTFTSILPITAAASGSTSTVLASGTVPGLSLVGYDTATKQLATDQSCAITGTIPSTGTLLHNCDTLHGMSGSPLLLSGKVVGIQLGSVTKADGSVSNIALDLSLVADPSSSVVAANITDEFGGWAGKAGGAISSTVHQIGGGVSNVVQTFANGATQTVQSGGEAAAGLWHNVLSTAGSVSIPGLTNTVQVCSTSFAVGYLSYMACSGSVAAAMTACGVSNATGQVEADPATCGFGIATAAGVCDVAYSEVHDAIKSCNNSIVSLVPPRSQPNGPTNTFMRFGNNGTTNCNNWCALATIDSQGPGTCFGGFAGTQDVSCDATPGQLPNGEQLVCTCNVGNFRKDGNNGTDNCNDFCQNSSKGSPAQSGQCLSGALGPTPGGVAVSCDVAVGIVTNGELACFCH